VAEHKAKSSNASSVTSNEVNVGAKRRGRQIQRGTGSMKTNIWGKNATKSAQRCTRARKNSWTGPGQCLCCGPMSSPVGWLHLRNVACCMPHAATHSLRQNGF